MLSFRVLCMYEGAKHFDIDNSNSFCNYPSNVNICDKDFIVQYRWKTSPNRYIRQEEVEIIFLSSSVSRHLNSALE